jgi:hypothetical protein
MRLYCRIAALQPTLVLDETGDGVDALAPTSAGAAVI